MKTIKTKRAVLSLLVCLSMSISKAHAQNIPARMFKEGIANRITDYMKSYYSLSDAQYKDVEVINANFLKNAKPVILSDEEKMAKLQKIKKMVAEREVALRKVFTQEQTQLFETKKKERQALLRAWLDE